MKRFAVLIQFVCALVFFLASPLSSVHAWMPGEDFGTDTDAAVINDQMNAAAYSLDAGTNHILVPTCLIHPFKGEHNCTNDPARYQQMVKKSAIGNIASAMGAMYDNPPADLALWVRDTRESLGFIPERVNAQGVGFTGLVPFLPIWKAFRNIAYVLLALAMIVVGFMVMLRKRIDPKTVVTVQNALPRIVIALILITFSYAIVGLLIDLMYLVIAFVMLIIQSSLPDAMPYGINYVSGGVLDLLAAIFAPLPKWLVGDLVIDVQQQQVGEFFRDFGSGLISTKLIVGPLFLFIVALAYLYAFIRMLFLLLGAYTQILLAVLTGPIQILADVFPGANAFYEWIKNLVANLVVFPITIFFLMIANVISQYIGEQTLWAPPFIPNAGGLAEMLISLGIIMTIPNVANGIKESMKAKSALEAGPGVIFGPLGRAGGTAMQGAYQISMIASGAQALFGKFGGKDNKGGHTTN